MKELTMYDWNALWHERDGYKTGYHVAHDDINQLATELSANLYKPAADLHDVAVYETPDKFILAGHDDGLQLLEMNKHHLFDVTTRLVTEDEGQDTPLPYVEIHVDNLATAEQALWRGAITLNQQGQILVAGQPINAATPPAITFDTLSFNNNERFRAELARVWREDIPALQPLIDHWFEHGELAEAKIAEHHYGDAARIQEICDRYAEMVQREQAVLSRLFSDNELHLIAAVLKDIHFDSAAACRGLWLAVEARLVHDELDRQLKVDSAALLNKMKALSYAQEVALIEALSPLPENAIAED
ncbi:MAG TPA: hypothetical protein VJ642_01855 [Chromobacteriaceae bacterium]|nr:hypothetical protein [Chromobacteriaceae bacterium]